MTDQTDPQPDLLVRPRQGRIRGAHRRQQPIYMSRTGPWVIQSYLKEMLAFGKEGVDRLDDVASWLQEM